jgi:DeoR/GlpR family transcriptional regulator of sugar metabolism
LTTFSRQQQVLNIIRNEPGIRVPDIARRLSFSQSTVRNYLNALANRGEVIRVHGGAVIIETTTPASPAFATRARANSEAKDMIARTASLVISDGDSILLDASTTAYALAKYIQDRHNLRIVTNGIEVARLLASNLSNTVILLGGVLRPDGASITGSLSEKILRDLHITRAFVSSSGFSPDIGLTEIDINEAQLKEIAIRSATEVIALIDSSKFGKTDLTPFARPDQITHLFTDCFISETWIEKLDSKGILYTISNIDQ